MQRFHQNWCDDPNKSLSDAILQSALLWERLLCATFAKTPSPNASLLFGLNFSLGPFSLCAKIKRTPNPGLSLNSFFESTLLAISVLSHSDGLHSDVVASFCAPLRLWCESFPCPLPFFSPFLSHYHVSHPLFFLPTFPAKHS